MCICAHRAARTGSDNSKDKIQKKKSNTNTKDNNILINFTVSNLANLVRNSSKDFLRMEGHSFSASKLSTWYYPAIRMRPSYFQNRTVRGYY